MTGMDLVPTGGDLRSQGLAHLSGLVRRQTRREVERVVAQTLIADAREQGRALIANTALENAGALSALEAHLITIAPLGEDRYKHIVDAYAMGAARAIARW